MEILTDEQYRDLGLKSGLEIHQQLDTGKKLFCRCPARTTNREPDARIRRHMRPTLSEMGTYDGTALMEFKTKKNVIYELYRDLVCTYEMDDTPPFPLNGEALDKSIMIALMMKCAIVDELHVSRKQYLDGSIPTGFQRTAIVGIEGGIPYGDREIGIIQLSLEEDACREMSDVGHTITFRTDRLSTPLVEVVTHAHMHTPREVQEVAERLGLYMRASGLVRRGNGATRQDVNVSITGGRRVEIKGVPKLDWIGRLVAVEALRQRALLEIRDELQERGITQEMIGSLPARDVSRVLGDSGSREIREALLRQWSVQGIVLPRFGGILDRETQPGGIQFRSEFSWRLKVIACLDTLPNMADSDEMPVHGISTGDREALMAELGAGDGDVAVIAWGEESDVRTAMEELKLRAIDALDGVPHETRQAFPDGHTEFERILPGADRMYPDTDTPPHPISETQIERLSKNLPDYPWDKAGKWIEMGVPSHMANRISISPLADLFQELVEVTPLKPAFIASAIHDTVKREARDLQRAAGLEEIPEKELKRAFSLLLEGTISKTGLKELISSMFRDRIGAEEALGRLGYRDPSWTEVEKLLEDALSSTGPDVDEWTRKKIMKGVMPPIRGFINGATVRDALIQKVGES